MDFLLFMMVGVIALLCRSGMVYLNRGWFRQGFVGDSSVHIAIVRQLSGDPRARYVDQYLISPEPMSYPTAFHRFCTLFPLDLLSRHPYIPNVVVFVLAAAGFFAFSRYVEFLHPQEGSLPVSAVALVMFFLSSGNLFFRGGEIAYLKLSERLLGRVSTAGFFLASSVGVAFDDMASMILATGLAVISLTGSIFGRQALIFITPVVCLLVMDVRPFVLVLAAAGLAAIVSGERFVNGMRHTVLTWKIYASHTKKSASLRKNLPRLVRVLDLWRRNAGKMNFMLGVLEAEPVRTLFRQPEVTLGVVFVALPFLAEGGDSREAVPWPMVAPVIGALLMYVVTVTERFNHLGECYRYLEYVLYFLMPLLIALSAGWYSAAWLVVWGSGYVLWLIVLRRVLGATAASGFPGRDVLGDFLEQLALPHGAVVFPVTMRVGADICARRPDIKSFWWQPGIISTEIYDEYIEEYPFLKRDFGRLISKHGVTHVICDKSAMRGVGWEYDFSGFPLILENDRYAAYSVPA